VRELVKRAKASADPHIREVAEDFAEPNGYLRFTASGGLIHEYHRAA
jgi:hypothetical protein